MVYVVHSDLDSFVYFNSDCPNDEEIVSYVEEEMDNAQNLENLGKYPEK